MSCEYDLKETQTTINNHNLLQNILWRLLFNAVYNVLKYEIQFKREEI